MILVFAQQATSCQICVGDLLKKTQELRLQIALQDKFYNYAKRYQLKIMLSAIWYKPLRFKFLGRFPNFRIPTELEDVITTSPLSLSLSSSFCSKSSSIMIDLIRYPSYLVLQYFHFFWVPSCDTPIQDKERQSSWCNHALSK